MVRRIIGAALIFYLFTLAIVYKFYLPILTLDNVLSYTLRKTVFILRALAGENNVEIAMLLLILASLPLLLKKPLYYFFKNLLGVELITIGWFGVVGIQNLSKPVYIIGMLPYDIAYFVSSLVGNTLGYVVFILSLVFGILLVLTSYKTSSKILGTILVSITSFIQKTYEIMSSFEKSEYTKPERSESTFYQTKKDRDKFIEITEIDIEEDRRKNDFSSVVESYKEKMEYKSIPYQDEYRGVRYNYDVNDGEGEIKDVEILNGDVVEESEKKESKFRDGFEGKYPPPIELLEIPEGKFSLDLEERKEIEDTKRVIQDTFEEFKIDATIEGVIRGPVVTMYEVKPKPGTKIAKIVNISDNLALNLATSRVRIVYPIPGKSVIGIEIPNKNRRIVKIREVIESKEYQESKSKLPLTLGIDIHGKPVVEDLTQMPHLLIAGSTGSGKSVYVNSIIAGLLYKRNPEELKFIMIDLKIVELKVYNGIPHLLFPVITTPNLAKAVLEWLVEEMQNRYKKLESLGCRDIVHYNSKVTKLNIEKEKLPYIVLIIDEYADLMMTSPRETEDYITRLAAMSRAVGIHLIIATQRPSVDVVTGLIKANFPARVAFRVASKVDSRTILDTIGAEKLLGKGDLLFMSPSYPSLIRIQGCYISNEEVERIVDYLIEQDSPNYIDLSSILNSKKEIEDEEFSNYEDEEFSDELYNEALRIVIKEKKASASYLQRRLRIGYNRAARMIERMEEEGIVGPQQGSKPREILVDESYLEKLN